MIARLNQAIRRTGAPIVVGLDPNLKFIPDAVKEQAFREYGETAEGAAEAFWEFNRQIIDGIADLIPAVKPQIAMYEQFGLPGLAVFDRTVRYAKEKGLLVIGDVKRGDIGSTSESYAIGHLGGTQIGGRIVRGFDEDFVTVNPYLGSDGVKPFIEVAKKEDKGIFVLVKTSNPSSGELQDLVVSGPDGTSRPLYEIVGSLVDTWGADLMEDGYSNVGAVVGATYPEQGRILRKLMPHTVILVPGYGAQGGKGADLKHFFRGDGLGAIVNSSRGIIAAWREERYAEYGAERFAEASRAAVLAMKEDLKQAVG
ncbi:MAG: orotidine-5'-phosphate decarboxylase [Lachnospiraceae bacterium]|nr:orotidine-5'-phosphate decarboxylase [Lachnospiraceae bacterium]